ncbi:TatD family hydrolase [Deferribacterales bacterium RsTz2092]|nr:hydrolase TatD [Deferribacterales bacterium]
MWTDTHCHIHSAPLATDIGGILARARAAGVKRFITIGTDIADSRRAFELANNPHYDNIVVAVGVHPHDAADFKAAQIVEFERMAKSSKTLAIGEVGLDYYRNISPKDIQQSVFAVMIDIALSVNLPLVIHTRDASEDTIKILDNVLPDKWHKILFHCFSGDKLLLDWGLGRDNVFFSYAGNLTYKKATLIQDSLDIVPLDRLFIETDSPYLAPIPYRGGQNEPAYIVKTAEYVATRKDVKLDKLSEQLEVNFGRFFSK